MNILSIGGSDPSSGAGIQSDIKACQSLGAYCFTVITGVTSQNTTQFGSVELVSTKLLKEQLDMIFSDFEIDAIKIGMVYSSDIIKTIYNSLKEKTIPIILDPVIKSTTGGVLIESKAIPFLKKYLLPISTVITPNKFEAEFLTDSKSLTAITKKLVELGSRNIIITGLENKNYITDYIIENNKKYHISLEKIPQNNHGSGCNHSLAMCYYLASKKSIHDAAISSQKFAYNSIINAKNIGKGVSITQTNDDIYTILLRGIDEFLKIKDIYKHIPECQTNFVFSKENPSTIHDILGVEGRLVKSGRDVIMAGNLKYGGSKHVASALLVANKRFNQLRSAINIKFDTDVISKLQSNLLVSSYDRTKEPDIVKTSGSSILWGIKDAIESSEKQPDVIYHKGDIGKEPMIIIFGKTPKDVIAKLCRT